MSVDAISVEFAHFYLEEENGSTLSKEQIESALAARSVLDEHSGIKSSCELIDDYNTSQKSFEPKVILRQLEKVGTTLGVICSEASLVSTALNMSNHMSDSRIKGSILRYFNLHRKWPCSMLTAYWYAVRLELLPAPMNLLLAGDIDSLTGKRLINILDVKFTTVEREALRIVDEFRIGSSTAIEFRRIEIDLGQ